MTLNGMPLIHIRPNGQMLLRVAITGLVFLSIMSGCSTDWWVGDGRGDWTMDLYEGYAISKINSNEILLIHKDDSTDHGGAIVIPNYYVLGYQLYESYIGLEGICTQNISASEDELSAMLLSYYLLDTTNGKAIGPFASSNDYIEYCQSIELEIVGEWISVNPD